MKKKQLTKSKNSFVRSKIIFTSKIEKEIRRIHTVDLFYKIILGFFVLLFIGYYSLTSFLRYDHFYTGRYDLGNMTQVVWNTANGRFFQMTHPDGVETVSRLAFHADFILILFAPFYWIWDSPKVLLLSQAVILGLGAIFVYLISRKIIKDRNISLAFAVSYLLNPALSWSVQFDFHPVVLATTFLLGAIYFLLEKRIVLFFVFAFLAAITKEQVWFIVALFGPILYFYNKRKILGISVFSICLLVFYLLMFQVIPAAAPNNEHLAAGYFSDGEVGILGIIKESLSSPVETIQKAFDGDRLRYLNSLFLPFGYLPVLFPFWLVFTGPDFALNLLSDKEELHHIYYHYTATITPFLFLSSIFGVRVLLKYIKNKLVIAGFILLAAVFSAYIYGPIVGTQQPNDEMFFGQVENNEEIVAKLREIPIDKSVASTNEVGAQLSHRENIYTTGINVIVADYVVFFMHDPKLIEDGYNSQLMNELNENEDFEMTYRKNGLVIYRKK